MRVALFTPLSPVRSALADIIEGYLPHLSSLVDLTVVTTGDYEPTLALLKPGNEPFIAVINDKQFREQAETFDLVVYNLGDEPNIHGYMFDALHDYPGVVLLHDLVLHHAIFQRTWAQGKLDGYIEELNYSYGQETAERIVQEVRAGRYDLIANQYPLVERVLDSSLAVIGFNAHLVGLVNELSPDVPTLSLRYPFYLPEPPPDDQTITALRNQLGGSDRTIFATFGLFNSQKRLDVTLRAYQRLAVEYPQTTFAMVGAAIDQDLNPRLADLQLTDRVIATGWLSPAEFSRYMYAIDIAVQLRYPHVGGTPYTPIRLLGLGVPTIISDIEPQAEIPQEAVIRIVPDSVNEEEAVFSAMQRLLTQPEQREAIGQAGLKYIHTNHNPALLAQELNGFLGSVYAQLPRLRTKVSRRSRGGRSLLHPSSNLVYQAGKALADIGIYSSDTALLRAIAGAIYDLSKPS